MKNWILNHKKTTIGIGMLIIILILCFIMFSGTGNGKYGDRLDDIDKYKVSDKDIKKAENDIKDNDNVEDVKYHQEGRVLTFTIELNEDIKTKKSKKYIKPILDDLDKSILEYYDVQVFITCKEDSETYPIVAYKNKSAKEFVWGNM